MRDLGICFGVSLLFFVYLELEKVFQLWRRHRSADS
jgi:Ca2+-transporting ATPase